MSIGIAFLPTPHISMKLQRRHPLRINNDNTSEEEDVIMASSMINPL